MTRLPVLLVVRAESAPALAQALCLEGVVSMITSPSEAADAVREGWAELVVCERLPGWQALVIRTNGAGGTAVIWGPPPRGSERRDGLPEHLLSAEEPATLVMAVRNAEATLRRRASGRDGLEDRWSVRSAAQVSRVAQALAAQLDLPELAEEVRGRVRDLCDADGCELWYVDSDTGHLVTAPRRSGQSLQIPSGEGLIGRVAREARPLLLVGETLVQSGDPRGFGAGLEVGAAFGVPLIHRGDVLGVLEVMRAANLAFTDAEQTALKELSPYIAIALQNAQLTQRLRTAQAQLLSANADLERRVEQRTQQISLGKREWETTFDAIDDPIALQDGFVLRRVNRAYARMAGIPITEISGRTCHEALANRATPCPGCPVVSLAVDLRGEIEPREALFLRFSGFRLPDEAAGNALVVHYQDITRQRSLEARLRESERLASVGQLASGAAHEINNPLGFVSSNLSSLKASLEDVLTGLERLAPLDSKPMQELRELIDEGGEMIGDAMKGTQRVANIVKALRELSRQEIARMEVSPVNASVERAIYAELGEDRGRVSLTLESEARAEIVPLQLDRAVGHLLRNARQASAKPEGIRVRTWDDAQVIRIEIADEGEGIADEHVHHIFEPFFTTRPIGQGMGLGLTAAYGIVRRVGGTIEVKTHKGAGSTFSIVLPRVQQASQGAAA